MAAPRSLYTMLRADPVSSSRRSVSRGRHGSALVLALLLAHVFAFVFAGLAPQSAAQTISINQERVEISRLIEQVGEATGHTILFDESVRGSISIVAQRAVSLDEAWSMLDASLSILGFSLIPSTEGMWRIAKVADAIGESPFVRTVGDDSHAYVTSLISLRFAEPAEVLAVLEPLAGASVTIVSLEDSRSLIASGAERRIARLMSIASAIDHVEERAVRSRLLRYRDVSEVEGWLESLFDSGALARRDLEVWTDDRTNSLIYRGTGTESTRLLGFVNRFDLPIEGEGELQVFPVLNRDAEEVATILRKLGEKAQASAFPAVPLEATTALQESDYSISVDVPTRSLVVQGELEALRAVRETLEILDQAPQQIAVDLLITRIRTPSSFSLGFGFSIPLTAGDESGEILGRYVSNPSGAGFAATPSVETTVIGRVDQDLNVPFLIDETTGLAIPISNTGVITAGDIEIRNEVLIEPSLVLTAGDSHEIFVGSNVPVPVTGESGFVDADGNSTARNLLARTTNFERRDIGIKIGLEARAGSIGPIELDLDVELSELAPSLAGAIELVGPTFSEQKILTNARLKDGAVAIIALNQDTRKTESQSGTPFLSALPFLGWLFTDTVERTDDVHLILAARAKRIGSPSELVARTIRRRLAFERRESREASLPRVEKGEPAYAVLVTTRAREDDAVAIAEGLEREGHAAQVHGWTLRGQPLFDVYVRDLATMTEGARIASELAEAGWEPELTLLPMRS